MNRIDELPDPTEPSDEDHPDKALTMAAGVTAMVLTWLQQPIAAAVTSIGVFGKQLWDEHREAANLEALLAGVRERFAALGGRLDEVERKVVGPAAEEAVLIAIRSARRTARFERVRRFGEVLGGTLADPQPDWDEAAEFIQNLEELGDVDLKALEILWRVQRQAARGRTDLRMSLNSNDYTATWKDVLDRVERAAIDPDDWYSRCGRLFGFGLALLVQPNPSHQAPDAMCYRLTGRAVRLLRLLGRNVDKGAYPTIRYHPSGKMMRVEDQDEAARLGPEWRDTPYKS